MATIAFASLGGRTCTAGIVTQVEEKGLQLHEYREHRIAIAPPSKLCFSLLGVGPLTLFQHVHAYMVAKDIRMAYPAHEDDLWRLMRICVREQQLEVENNSVVITRPNNVAMPLHDVVLQR